MPFVGQKAFGWLAVILFGFSAAFFLRHAFQNNWIGPVGRVAIGEMVGVCLAVAGAFYFKRGLVRFSSMLTSAGVVVLYLSTYSAFGFYQLLPRTHAGIFLAIIVLTSMLCAWALLLGRCRFRRTRTGMPCRTGLRWAYQRFK